MYIHCILAINMCIYNLHNYTTNTSMCLSPTSTLHNCIAALGFFHVIQKL